MKRSIFSPRRRRARLLPRAAGDQGGHKNLCRPRLPLSPRQPCACFGRNGRNLFGCSGADEGAPRDDGSYGQLELDLTARDALAVVRDCVDLVGAHDVVAVAAEDPVAPSAPGVDDIVALLGVDRVGADPAEEDVRIHRNSPRPMTYVWLVVANGIVALVLLSSLVYHLVLFVVIKPIRLVARFAKRIATGRPSGR